MNYQNPAIVLLAIGLIFLSFAVMNIRQRQQFQLDAFVKLHNDVYCGKYMAVLTPSPNGPIATSIRSCP